MLIRVLVCQCSGRTGGVLRVFSSFVPRVRLIHKQRRKLCVGWLRERAVRRIPCRCESGMDVGMLGSGYGGWNRD